VTFAETIEAALPVMRGYALRLTRNMPDAEDVVQDAVLKALQHQDSFDPAFGQTTPWLCRIVRNAFIDAKRARDCRTRNEGECADSKSETVSTAMEEYIHTMRGLNLLREPQREVLQLAASGQRYCDIAAALDIPIGTVMSRLSRARQALR
jgi:RNA polymerase sigma-70 factor (ECF subfamily)